ncbi:drug/metabolite transporter (DMT)-like permease [Methylovorus glucosotrophus]|uniref:DMT family transporter n=1 Tax=Methylovorus glucosotrophus TaxID=266009 RepID=UPI00133126F1|nr:DMT family transporter [Methylovorus glucosotrophus]KAF0842836.1 drug/metabolite transporter (DMT)-like permease [Methylovorus glucosotrophus]
MKLWIYPLLTIMLWAGNVIVSKLASGIIAPPAITAYRLLVAISLMSLFVALPVWRNRRIIIPLLPKLVVLGFLSMAFYQCLSYWAADTSTATSMAIITAMTPLATLLASSLLLRDPPSAEMLLGAGIAFFGTTYLISAGSPSTLWHGHWRMGDLLMLGAVTSYAVYSVLLKYWKLPLPAWQSTYMQALSALVFMVPMLLRVPADQARLNAQSIPLILYAGVLASVLLPYFWIKGIEALGPNRCSMMMNLLPIFTAILAMLMLNEHLAGYHLIGGALVILGVMLPQLRRFWSRG